MPPFFPLPSVSQKPLFVRILSGQCHSIISPIRTGEREVIFPPREFLYRQSGVKVSRDSGETCPFLEHKINFQMLAEQGIEQDEACIRRYDREYGGRAAR